MIPYVTAIRDSRKDLIPSSRSLQTSGLFVWVFCMTVGVGYVTLTLRKQALSMQFFFRTSENGQQRSCFRWKTWNSSESFNKTLDLKLLILYLKSLKASPTDYLCYLYTGSLFHENRRIGFFVYCSSSITTPCLQFRVHVHYLLTFPYPPALFISYRLNFYFSLRQE